MKRLASLFLVAFVAVSFAGDAPKVEFPFKKGDRVAWVGSSSTRIGVWPKTMEFLLRTRHPDLGLAFERFTTGGGTFATGLQKMDEWLTPYKPSIVFFNYGGNDANAGEKGLPQFKKNIEDSIAKAKSLGADRVVLLTPQAADVRKSGEPAAAKRSLYADTLLAVGKERSYPVIDVHRPLADLQTKGQKDDDKYTILTDTIHLTTPAYIAWGYFQYDRLNPPAAVSSLALTADGKVARAEGCSADGIEPTPTGLKFTRKDRVLPILPPEKLPPRAHVPLERLSPYLFSVVGLKDGDYDVTCEGQPIGTATANALAKGVNLNSLLLESGSKAPWAAQAAQWWNGKNLDEIGKTAWAFEVKRK